MNPFLGLTDQRFAEAAQLMELAAGARLTMPRAFYLEAIAGGRISDSDLALALQRADDKASLPQDVNALKSALQNTSTVVQEPLSTVADAASRATGNDWAALACERISLWAASHFDEGQAPWSPPSRHLGPYAAWREEALIDRTPEVMGLAKFRQIIRSLPASAEATISEGVARLRLDETGLTAYFHRLLMSVAGWSGYARYRVWQSELRERSDTTLLQLLAVRLAWDVAILEVHGDNEAVKTCWMLARARFGQPQQLDPALKLDHLLQSAYEIGWQRGLLAKLREVPVPPVPSETARKTVQAAFCIDVRSEVFRRALESVSPEIDTLGFAGFFGM
ncbi:MAG: putative inorganic carbon transporter subunit DabA, partial [Pseudomonadota bacterium]